MSYCKDTGNQGENIAAEYLLKQGYTILERNWRHRSWEIDIIGSRGKFLVFFEVKTRTSERFGKPEASIGQEKMNHLKKAAEEYLYRHPDWKFIRFDVIAITLQQGMVREIFVIEDVFF
jgi:putative endonuclease